MDQGRNVFRVGMVMASIAVTAFLANLLHHRWRVAEESREWVKHSGRVQEYSERVALRVRDLQLGQRGYLITGDPEFLEPYWLAVGRPDDRESQMPESTLLLTDVRALREQTSDNPAQQANAERLANLVSAKLAFVDASIRLRREKGAAALQSVDWHEGKRLMDGIRDALREMAALEDSLHQTRWHTEDRDLQANTILLYGTVAFFYLLGLLALWLATRNSAARRRAEEELRKSAALMDAVVNGTDYAVIAADSEDIVRIFSRGAERMLGYKAEDFIGKPVIEATRGIFLQEELAARAERIAERHGRRPQGTEVFNLPLGDEGPYGQEWTHVRADGSRLTVALSVWNLADAEGNPQGSVAIARDITRIKSLEHDLRESSSRLQAVIDGIDYAIFATDAKGILRLVNRGTDRILGYSVADMVGRPVNELAARFADPAELRARASRLGKHYGRLVSDLELISLPLPDDGPFGQEWTHTRPDGARVTLAFSVYSLTGEDGKPTGVVALARDITQLKALERMKSEFISTVSHELRTPLTSIRGALGLAAGGAAGELPKKAAELVSIAHRNSERLVHIINDILDIEKIESGKLSMHPEPLQAAEFLRQAVEANRAYGERYGVNFVLKEVDPDATVFADPDRLMQVMANLLSNAAKFSPRDSEVWISAQPAGAALRFSVRDFGAGISNEFRDRVFEKFAQAEDSSTRRRDGTGLGLSITRKLVEAMQGRIEFSSTVGKGTEFRFTVPLAAPEASFSPEPAFISPDAAAEECILVCEDDRDVSKLLRLILERSGFAVEAAYSLAEARRRLKSREYAAMTLDLMLPDGSGVDFLKELRAESRWSDLPVVVLSARADEGRKELNGDAIGMIAWMTKPIDEGILVRALRGAVSGAGTRKPRILHVEDDADLRAILARSLADQVEWRGAATVEEAEALLRREPFDLVVLDLALPDGSGLELLERLNKLTGVPVPVLILSASEAEAQVRARVEATLVKSRMSEERIIQTILAVIHKHAPG